MGRNVRWRWQWVSYSGQNAGAFEFAGMLGSDNTITGTVERHETSFSANFNAKRGTRTTDVYGITWLGHAADDEVGVCAIVAKPSAFNHQTVALQGTAVRVKQTTSRRGNEYTTFGLQDASGCGPVNIFTWGHLLIGNGDRVSVEGVFETEHNEGGYTFYNEINAAKVSSLSR
jgi:hypothetical protein